MSSADDLDKELAALTKDELIVQYKLLSSSFESFREAAQRQLDDLVFDNEALEDQVRST
jgi:hypothetical protein